MAANRHLEQPVVSWGTGRSEARMAVMAVHGRGQSPSFMQEQSLRIRSHGIRYYAPRAFGDSWYPRPFMEPIEGNEPYVAEAQEALRATLLRMQDDGFAPQDTVLWGFSQGACLLSHFILTTPMPFGGLLLFTGGYIGNESVESQQDKPLHGVPVLIRSIEHDPWVPSSRVQDTAEILTRLGAKVDLRISPGSEHIITDEAMSAASRLLSQEPRKPAARHSHQHSADQ
ncbi:MULTISPECIES: alpha/beta hydrolase [Micrococcaceae]|uniref:Esterase n=3 Tax=Micrococcaceae TaxID=1268 RepID=A0ACC6TL45_9MICC|nr:MULTISPECIES: phospholipase [Micrococcaceae]ACL42541.1 phospholipase/Carboxylesterase [Pseudarthrobacter chlorophenolicus A6]SDQ08751.1 phospholipase/carboxylesterase [Pseudarthrobacter chlorophenolicus]SDQ10714.1 phospholipase/carboxylesterase [Pseudarthrobacter chlorophenolicus]